MLHCLELWIDINEFVELSNSKAGQKKQVEIFKSLLGQEVINDLPQELYELDILDGSPPCSSFSMAGNREKDWGKDKVFREGQAMQVLDTLFFIVTGKQIGRAHV